MYLKPALLSLLLLAGIMSFAPAAHAQEMTCTQASGGFRSTSTGWNSEVEDKKRAEGKSPYPYQQGIDGNGNYQYPGPLAWQVIFSAASSPFTLLATGPGSYSGPALPADVDSATWTDAYMNQNNHSCTSFCEAYPNATHCMSTPSWIGKTCAALTLKSGNTASSIVSVAANPYTQHVGYEYSGLFGYNYQYGGTTRGTCQPVPKPDLVAAAPSPATAVAGTAKTFSVAISNAGDATASAGSTRFQRATSAAGAGAATMADVSTAAIAKGASLTKSVSYTFATAGTFYVRACADIGNTTVESNEANNCGAWSSVTVHGVPTATLALAPATVAYGGTTKVTWSSTNATSCTGTNFSTGGAMSGSVNVANNTASKSFRVDCSGPGGNSYDSKTLTVGAQTFPDLTAGGVTPAIAVAGTAKSFSATVTNDGNANAGLTMARFQRATSAAGAGAVSIGDVTTSAINVDVSRTVSLSYTFATAGTFYVRACADIGNTTVESNEANNCGVWSLVTVSAAPASDLTAGSVTPATATEDSPVTLSAAASNIGNATSGSFPMLFQISQNGALFNSAYLAGITAGSSRVATASYTFTAPGTYQVRACANNNTSWVNIVTEDNYGNNCGPWTNVVVAAAAIPSVSCTVSPSTIDSGGTVTYRANPADGATGPYTWIASDGANVGTGATVTRTLTTPGIYAMDVRASGTAVSHCPNVSVRANWCTAGASDLEITATPARVRAGDSVSLTWSASGVLGQGTSCTVTGPGVNWSNAVSAPPACSASGSATPTINTQSTYTLRCGSAEESVTVNVIPNFEEF